MKKHNVETTDWLEQAYPQMHFLLLALDGDESAARWLSHNSTGVALFTRALRGDKHAMAGLENGQGDHLDDLFELIDNDDLLTWMATRRPELHALFVAVKGDPLPNGSPTPRKAHARQLAALRKAHDRFLQRSQLGDDILNDSAADMGCLIGEMHLKQGEYEKAIEAFSRAIDTHASTDLYEGRARAYRGLAERDLAAAELLRLERTS